MRLTQILPVIIFAVLIVALGAGLSLNPKEIPSALIDKPAPEFGMPPLYEGADDFTKNELQKGELAIVNVFASWCVPCIAEHPVLVKLKEEHGYTIHGINYKDRPADAKRFLEQLGNPYTLIGKDRLGRNGIEWGVYGVPETFIIDGSGQIRFKYTGPMNDAILRTEILPVLEELKGQ